MGELTDKEKEFLVILFEIAQTFIERVGGDFNIAALNYDTFDRNDLYNLATKFEIENRY